MKANSGGASLVVADSAHGKIIDDIRAEASRKKVPVTTENRDYFRKFGSSSAHQGVALFLQEKIATSDEKSILTEIVARKGVLVLLDHLSDPHNAGAIIRTAEALGCDGVVMPEANAVGITSTVIKSSAGATAHIPIINISNVASFLDRAREAGFWIIGTSDHGQSPLSEISKFRPAVVVIGSEGTGMKRLTGEKCHSTVAIPLKGKVSSLNASVAAGIILYEIMK
jgi:23S rRNA (guanosine2251-2'-O)-methyltransferase